jgi:hypothetical protein
MSTIPFRVYFNLLFRNSLYSPPNRVIENNREEKGIENSVYIYLSQYLNLVMAMKILKAHGPLLQEFDVHFNLIRVSLVIARLMDFTSVKFLWFFAVKQIKSHS